MNAEEQIRVGRAIAEAFERAGIVVERSVVRGGNVSGWVPVKGPEIAVALVCRGWKVNLDPGAQQ